jgi:hypothetical protein
MLYILTLELHEVSKKKQIVYTHHSWANEKLNMLCLSLSFLNRERIFHNIDVYKQYKAKQSLGCAFVEEIWPANMLS